MTLDFGQKDSTVHCSICSMLYTPSDAEDLKTHARFHANFLNQEIKVPRWQNQQVLEDFLDGSRIIELSLTDHRGFKLYTKVAALMNRDLGHDLPEGRNAAAETWPPYLRVFVFVEGKKKLAVGCCFAEELTRASVTERGYSLRRLQGGRQSLVSWRIQHDSEQPAVPPPPSEKRDSILFPLCGIRRLWVAAKHRRQGVGTTLIDCVLKHFIYLTQLPRSQVAFAEPTANGADFAASFTGREDFIIY
ncbi:unnamed protein product [Mesocestoides corti]|nr:unnamed protein product [Mesocestoides corti]